MPTGDPVAPKRGAPITAEFLAQLAQLANKADSQAAAPRSQGISTSSYTGQLPTAGVDVLYVQMIRDALLQTDPNYDSEEFDPPGEENAEVLEWDDGQGAWANVGGRKVNVVAVPGNVPEEGDTLHVRYDSSAGGWIPVDNATDFGPTTCVAIADACTGMVSYWNLPTAWMSPTPCPQCTPGSGSGSGSGSGVPTPPGCPCSAQLCFNVPGLISTTSGCYFPAVCLALFNGVVLDFATDPNIPPLWPPDFVIGGSAPCQWSSEIYSGISDDGTLAPVSGVVSLLYVPTGYPDGANGPGGWYLGILFQYDGGAWSFDAEYYSPDTSWSCTTPLAMKLVNPLYQPGFNCYYYPPAITLEACSGGIPVIGSPPVVTQSFVDVCQNASSIAIHGSGFLAAGNTVALNLGAVAGTVTFVSTVLLQVTLSTSPTSLGALTAVVTNANGSSGPAVQVGLVITSSAPTVTLNTATIPQATGPFTFYGTNFDPTPGNNFVTMSSGTFIVTSSTLTSISGTFTMAPAAGVLTAQVKTLCGGSSGAAVEVADVIAAGGGPVLVDHASVASLVSAISTGSMPNIPAGVLVVVVVNTGGGNPLGTLAGVTLNGSPMNFVQTIYPGGADQGRVSMYWINTPAITGVVNISAPAGNTSQFLYALISIPGLTVGAEDTNTYTFGASSSPDSGSFTPLANNTCVIAADLNFQPGGGSPTWGGGFTNLVTFSATLGVLTQLSVAYKSVGAAVPVDASTTGVTPASWAINMASFK